ncbi:hypothetical protein PLICRDRAFT_177899 [Plicaturopsis crispa FD-325 SS-3]|nr:hypothetical protein PLICRDRAFT_177899 [Plicaturopsis crispa FD-325 SS-3]
MKTTSPPRTPPHSHLLKTSEPRARHTTNTHTHTARPTPAAFILPPPTLYISNAPDTVSTCRRRPPAITPPQRVLPVRSLASAIDPGHFSGTFLEDHACVPSTGSEPGRWHSGEGMGKRRAHLLTHHSASDAPAVPDPGTTGANDAADQPACMPCKCTQLPPCSFAQPPARTFAQPPPRMFAQPPLRTFAQPPARTFAQPPPRMFAQPPPRTFAQPQPPLHISAQVHAGPAVHVCAGPTVQPARTPGNSVQAPPYTFAQAPLLPRISATTQPARMPRNSAQPWPSTFAQHPPSPHTFAPAPWHRTCSISASV